MPLDPVCGAFVRESERAIQAPVAGHRYHFCSKSCLRRFTAPERELAWMTRSAAFALGAGVVLAAMPHLGWVGEPSLGWFLLALGTLVQALAGWPFYQGLGSAVRARAANTDTLVALGTTAAWTFGAIEVLSPEFLVAGGQQYYFEVGALVLGFVAAGRALEQRLRGEATWEVRKLLGLQPTSARVLRDGAEVQVPVEELAVDDVVVVGTDEVVPADGIVAQGQGAVDEKLLTGEPMPADKRPGDRVVGGSVNRGPPLQVRVTQVGGETALARIVALIGEAQTAAPTFRSAADRLSAWLVPLVALVALASFAGWMYLGGEPLPYAFSAGVAVLLIASPCALGLATPSALAVGVTKGANQGILVKDAEVLERFQKVDVVVFDKTGTITKGEPELTDVIPLRGDAGAMLAAAAAAEERSEHPLARTIVRAARAKGLEVPQAGEARTWAGVGVEALVGREEILVGSLRLCRDRGVDTAPVQDRLAQLQDEGKTVVLVARGGALEGLLAFADPIRPEAQDAVHRLKAAGIEPILITGDNVRTAQAVARTLGIRRSYADITPLGKSAVVRGLRDGDHVVAMVGDGINDAPALAAADIGVTIGQGSGVALEAADVVLLKNDPRDIPAAIALSRKTFTKVQQNLRWAFGYNAILVPIAALGLLNPVLAGLAMAFGALPVIGNSARAARSWDAE